MIALAVILMGYQSLVRLVSEEGLYQEIKVVEKGSGFIIMPAVT